MTTHTDSEVQHLVNLSGVAISMIRNPDFITDLAAADSAEQRSIGTCLQILADTTELLMRLQRVRPRYRTLARTRPHGVDPARQPPPSDHDDLFPYG